jgi:hypothetical protein
MGPFTAATTVYPAAEYRAEPSALWSIDTSADGYVMISILYSIVSWYETECDRRKKFPFGEQMICQASSTSSSSPHFRTFPKANSEAPSKYLFIRTAKRPNGFEASHKEIVA